jgi:Uma2 family endonuclease
MNDNRHILKDDGYIHGAPDIIIEVLSSDTKRDLVKKKSLYERAGVKEYFVVNPDNRDTTLWSLTNGSYTKQYNSIGVFKSAILSFAFEF